MMGKLKATNSLRRVKMDGTGCAGQGRAVKRVEQSDHGQISQHTYEITNERVVEGGQKAMVPFRTSSSSRYTVAVFLGPHKSLIIKRPLAAKNGYF